MPTRVRYHQESDTCGVLVLETTPQVRTLNFQKITDSIFDNVTQTKLVALPYVIQVINYRLKSGIKTTKARYPSPAFYDEMKSDPTLVPSPYMARINSEEGNYVYGGINWNGLHVFMNDGPLETLNSDVGYSVLDQSGLICTSHGYDYSVYPTLGQMATAVTGLWWGVTHYGNIKKFPAKHGSFPWTVRKAMLSKTSAIADTAMGQHSAWPDTPLINVPLSEVK